MAPAPCRARGRPECRGASCSPRRPSAWVRGRAEGAGSSAWRARSARHRLPGSRDCSFVLSCFGGGGFARVLLAKETFEHIQTVSPEALVEAQPFVGAGEWSGVEAAEMGAAAHLAPDQSGVLQRLYVLLSS